MRFGRSVPDGFLPVFRVPTEKDAKNLLVLACPRNLDGEFVAPDLVVEQTLENLEAFSLRLQRAWDLLTRKGP